MHKKKAKKVLYKHINSWIRAGSLPTTCRDWRWVPVYNIQGCGLGQAAEDRGHRDSRIIKPPISLIDIATDRSSDVSHLDDCLSD